MSNSKPRISVLIPVYNTELYIEETIDSVLNQTFKNFELIIVDDCSTDNTYLLCQTKAKEDSRIKLYKNERNLGMMPNWNHGLTFCKSEYFAKLDADDLWTFDFLEKCIKILDAKPEIGLVCSGYKEINEEGKYIPDSTYLIPEEFANQSFSFFDLLKRGPEKMFETQIARQGIGVLRRTVFDQLGNFSLLPAGDSEMWFRVGVLYQGYAIDEVCHFHRIWTQSFVQTQVVQNSKLEENLFDATKLIYKQYLTHGMISYFDYLNYNRKALYHYSKFIAFNYRKERAYVKMFLQYLKMFLSKPISTITFFLNRVSY